MLFRSERFSSYVRKRGDFNMILLDEYKAKLSEAEKMLKEAGESL